MRRTTITAVALFGAVGLFAAGWWLGDSSATNNWQKYLRDVQTHETLIRINVQLGTLEELRSRGSSKTISDLEALTVSALENLDRAAIDHGSLSPRLFDEVAAQVKTYAIKYPSSKLDINANKKLAASISPRER